MVSVLERLLAVGVSYALILLAMLAVPALFQRLGISGPDLRNADTWHGRPVSRDDHDPDVPQWGFLLFVVAMLVVTTAVVLTVNVLLYG